MAYKNSDPSVPLVTVEDIVRNHWSKYGRNYYCRWDFEGMPSVGANNMMDKMRSDISTNTGRVIGKYTISKADDFIYVDPVDGSVTKKQGIRFLMSDGSRIVFRLSGTAGSGATVRMYIEQYEPDLTVDFKSSTLNNEQGSEESNRNNNNDSLVEVDIKPYHNAVSLNASFIDRPFNSS